MSEFRQGRELPETGTWRRVGKPRVTTQPGNEQDALGRAGSQRSKSGQKLEEGSGREDAGRVGASTENDEGWSPPTQRLRQAAVRKTQHAGRHQRGPAENEPSETVGARWRPRGTDGTRERHSRTEGWSGSGGKQASGELRPEVCEVLVFGVDPWCRMRIGEGLGGQADGTDVEQAGTSATHGEEVGCRDLAVRGSGAWGHRGLPKRGGAGIHVDDEGAKGKRQSRGFGGWGEPQGSGVVERVGNAGQPVGGESTPKRTAAEGASSDEGGGGDDGNGT